MGVLVLTPDALLIRFIHVDTWTLLFWRGLLQALAIIGFYVVRYGRQAWRQWVDIGWIGVCVAALYTASNIFFIQSIRLTYVANTLLILASAPLLGAVFSWLFLRKNVRLRTWVATVLGLLGVAIIFSGGRRGDSLMGELLALAAACFIAGTFGVIRGAKSVNMIPAVALSGFMIALVPLPMAGTPLTMTGQDAVYLILLGAVIAPLSFALITLGPRTLTAPEVSLVMLLETVLGPAWV